MIKIGTTEIVLASLNRGKVLELQELLKDLPYNWVSQADLNLPEVAETGTTFVENAIIKARHAAQLSGLPALADDSGLVVNSLHGAPGVYSARYAGPQASDSDLIDKLLYEMRKAALTDRNASFHCVLALLRYAEDPAPIICHGIWQGEILSAPQGRKGFGYDPVFWIPALQCSAAEMDPMEKNRISHRGRAMAQLKLKLAEN